MEHFALKYLRKDRMPHMFCPGCGIGIVINTVCKALDDLNIDLDDIIMVSGIGCSSRTPGYFNCDSLHTTHGRALAFATGIKAIKPDKKIIAFTGDGDCAAIGGNHFIHTCRRNLDITIICINNYIYGMTGGQVSPTTPKGMRGTTAPYGNFDKPFDLCNLAESAGASYVARWTTSHPFQLVNSIKKGINKKGTAFIEVLSQCYTYYGRLNRIPSNIELMKLIKENTILKSKAEQLLNNGEDIGNKVIIGEFVDRECETEFSEELHKYINEVSSKVEK